MKDSKIIFNGTSSAPQENKMKYNQTGGIVKGRKERERRNSFQLVPGPSPFRSRRLQNQ